MYYNSKYFKDFIDFTTYAIEVLLKIRDRKKKLC